MKNAWKYRFGSIEYDLASRTHVMGILNVTPDSFSDGGRYLDIEHAVRHAIQMVEEGADFIDIGGESTRPGSESVTADEEIRRIIPVIESVKKYSMEVPVSVDTSKADVADAALQAGAVIVNDISAMTSDALMAPVVVKHHATIVLMHMQGSPKTMQQQPRYLNVTEEVNKYLSDRVEVARQSGIIQIIIDPGIGFGKAFEHNIQLLKELRSFTALGIPLLVGVSRKSFLGAILNLPPTDRVEGTSAAVTAAILNGAAIVRVHDVKEMKRVAMVSDALKSLVPAAKG
jgi:dihydropteroate synthase